MPSKNLIDLKQTPKYIRFLLAEISRYKADWQIDLGEAQAFKNELEKFYFP